MTYHEIDDNLTNPEFFAQGDVQGLFAQLRIKDPVHWTQGRLSKGFWSVTKYKDMQTVYLDPEIFSSQRGGTILPTSTENEEISESENLRYGIEIVNTDAPRHTQMRRLLDPVFRKNVVRGLDDMVREIVDDILDEIVPRGDCDFVSEFAMRLPTEMICKIMGVPREDWSKMILWTDMALGSEDSAVQIEGSAFETKKQGFEQMFNYCHNLAMSRRAEPTDDVTSRIATSEVDGDRLTELELGWNTLVLVMAGLETARNAMSGAALAFAEFPEQLEILSADHSLIPSAVDEILRWTSPATHTKRNVTKDVELGGKQLRAGDWVVLWLPSANRDENIFEDPFLFDVQRKPNRHLTFGYGPHFCIGRELARLEIELMLEGILKRNLRFSVNGEVERVASNLVAGIKMLPMRISKASETEAAVQA